MKQRPAKFGIDVAKDRAKVICNKSLCIITPDADCEARGSVAEGNEQRHLGAALHHARDADAPRQQLVRDLQEAVSRARYLGGEAPVACHIA